MDSNRNQINRNQASSNKSNSSPPNEINHSEEPDDMDPEDHLMVENDELMEIPKAQVSEEDMTYHLGPVQQNRIEEGSKIMRGALFQKHRIANFSNRGISDEDFQMIFYHALTIPFLLKKNLSTSAPTSPFTIQLHFSIDERQLVLARHLSSLWELNLSHNLLRHLPDALFGLVHTARIILKKNLISQLPDCLSFSRLTCLQYLDLSENHIEAVPPILLQLPTLLSLNLAHNQIAALPELALPALKWLSLEKNQIRSLPSILKCSQLWVFFPFLLIALTLCFIFLNLFIF